MSSYHGPGTYWIVNSATGTVVDLYLGGSAAGTDINGWDTSFDVNNTHQIWQIADVGRGAVIILNVGSGTYISAPKDLSPTSDPPTATTARVTGNPGSPTDPYNRWTVQSQSDGSVAFGSVAYPEKVLDLDGSGTASGTPILAWGNLKGKNQRWTLVPFYN